MSTIRKAYMEISNGIRGLRFHRDQPQGGGPQHEKGLPSEDPKPVTRNAKHVVHTEENAVATAVSRLFPASGSVPPRVEHPVTGDNKHATSPETKTQSSSLPSQMKSSPLAWSAQNAHSPNTDPPGSKGTNGDSTPTCQNGRLKRPTKDSIFTPTKLIGSPKAGIANRIRKLNMSMTGQKWETKPETISELMQEETFLSRFFFYFSYDDRRVLCRVCKKWKNVLYQSVYWLGLMPVINFKDWNNDGSKKKICFEHFQIRGFDQVCFVAATDKDIIEFINNTPSSKKSIRSVSLRCSNITDSALENLIRKLPCLNKLELSNCNEVTGSGLWACLNPRIIVLTITDCIHIADDTIGAIAQLLPALHELNLQAYHVTDNGLALFDSKLNASLRILRLKSCWEITNHGVVNIIHALPNLTVLSLSGCTKVTDDGVEIIAENMKKLKSLDLSWCSRVTDASLEYVACDLGILEELVLDRCTHITDIGIGYVSTMTSLTRLYIRWCVQVGDFGLHHIFSMRNLRVLSIAGCRRLTSNGLYGLRHLQRLEELEVTNCPGANSALCRYLKDNMPNTMIIE
ncbi:F-box/LRR-repeat protein 16-like [Physella acuta]|uniref:F-box/LRR-repeat protein 16-like n=1 Tax=Physella acuta TaxID=109671 RepID=UPI0027DB1B4B|nr:F-box/LRR-repeat protein 16-like [Physella acuta]